MVSSCVLGFLKQDLRSKSSSYSRISTLRAYIYLGERIGFPMSKLSLDEWMSMTWVTCASGVEEAARLAATSSLVDGSYCLLLSGVKWLPWAVNTSEVQGLERGDPLCEFLRSCGIDG